MRNVRLCFIFFFILLVSSSIVSAGFWDFLTGKVTGETCTESDAGQDYYIKGTVTYTGQTNYIPDTPGGNTYTDACGGSAVNEFYCENGELKSASFSGCVYGCMNGACLATKPECVSNNDCPKEILKYCDGANACTSTTNSNCDNGKCVEAPGIPGECTTCPNGCKDGTCLKEPEIKCTDSDGGKNYYVKGTTTYGSVNKTDSCVSGACEVGKPCYPKGYLQEYFCSEIGIKSESFECPNDCSNDGACVKEKVLPPFTMAVDDKAPASDVILISDVAVALKQRGYTMPIDTTKLFSEVNALWLDKKVTLAVYKGEAIIILGATSPASHVIFATELANILSEKSIKRKTILSNELPSANLLDLFKGCVSNNDCPKEILKFCNGANACTSTTNSNCDNGKCVEAPGIPGECITCSNGCKDGACVKEVQPTCTDSDGGFNLYKKGTATATKDSYSQSKTDYCDGGNVFEYYCRGSNNEVIDNGESGTHIDGEYETCPNGCTDGACIKEPTTCEPTKCDDGTIYECEFENGQCLCPACPPIIVKPVCGNGICESGEGEVCIAIAAMCEEGKECKVPPSKCYVVCPQDCKPTEGIYANLNDKFNLQVYQPVKIRENEKDIMKITFKDLIAYKCKEQTVTAKTVEEKVAVAEAAMTGRVVTLPQQTAASATSVSGGGKGAAVIPAQSTVATEILKCIGSGPKALLDIGILVNSDLGKHKTLNLDIGEKKQIDEFTISFLSYDYASRSGTFLVSRETFSCPPQCKCDEKGKVIECLTGEKCESGNILCPDGKCREKCEIVTEDCKYGCAYEGKCFPVSLRNNGMYCSADLVMSSQKGSDEKCDNNFECSTNVCIDGKCVSSGFIQKIMNWFKGLFGG